MKNKVLISLILSTSLLTSCSETTSNTSFDINRYDEYLDKCRPMAREFMPPLDSFNDYKDISVSLTSSDYFLGSKDADPYGLILFVSYDEEIFDSKKEEIIRNYIFVNNPIISDYDNDILMPAIDIMYYDYRIRVVYDEDFWYPKYFGMIGINDDIQTIAYLYYENIDIDLIAYAGTPIEKQESFFIYLLSKYFIFSEKQY